jgi:hypothetical protein
MRPEWEEVIAVRTITTHAVTVMTPPCGVSPRLMGYPSNRVRAGREALESIILLLNNI